VQSGSGPDRILMAALGPRGGCWLCSPKFWSRRPGGRGGVAARHRVWTGALVVHWACIEQITHMNGVEKKLPY
jgi:hypothetical protein